MDLPSILAQQRQSIAAAKQRSQQRVSSTVSTSSPLLTRIEKHKGKLREMGSSGERKADAGSPGLAAVVPSPLRYDPRFSSSDEESGDDGPHTHRQATPKQVGNGTSTPAPAPTPAPYTGRSDGIGGKVDTLSLLAGSAGVPGPSGRGDDGAYMPDSAASARAPVTPAEAKLTADFSKLEFLSPGSVSGAPLSRREVCRAVFIALLLMPLSPPPVG